MSSLSFFATEPKVTSRGLLIFKRSFCAAFPGNRLSGYKGTLYLEKGKNGNSKDLYKQELKVVFRSRDLLALNP